MPVHLLALAAAAAVAVPAPPAAVPTVAPAKPKMICKRSVQIGTLAGVTKTCHSEADWQAIYRGGRSAAEAYQTPSGSLTPITG